MGHAPFVKGLPGWAIGHVCGFGDVKPISVLVAEGYEVVGEIPGLTGFAVLRKSEDAHPVNPPFATQQPEFHRPHGRYITPTPHQAKGELSMPNPTVQEQIAEAKRQQREADQAKVREVFDNLLAPVLPAAKEHVRFLAAHATEYRTVVDDAALDRQFFTTKKHVSEEFLERVENQAKKFLSYTSQTQSQLTNAIAAAEKLSPADVLTSPGEQLMFGWPRRAWRIYESLTNYARPDAITNELEQLRFLVAEVLTLAGITKPAA